MGNQLNKIRVNNTDVWKDETTIKEEKNEEDIHLKNYGTLIGVQPLE